MSNENKALVLSTAVSAQVIGALQLGLVNAGAVSRLVIRKALSDLRTLSQQPAATRCAECNTPNSCGGDGKCLEQYIKARISQLPVEPLTDERVQIVCDFYSDGIDEDGKYLFSTDSARKLIEAVQRGDKPAEHDLYTDADKDRPEAICDRNGQVVLSLCKRCGKGECDLLDTPCTPKQGTPS